MIPAMVQKIKNIINERIFRECSKKILQIEPYRLASNHDGVCLLSQVQDKDITMYLLAVRSFFCHVNVSRCVVLGDNLTEKNKKLLSRHIVGIEVRDVTEFQFPALPIGGTWERLYAISKYVQSDDVVQLDADTLTLKDLEIINRCIHSNRGFLLGTENGREIKIAGEAVAFADYQYQKGQDHIQILAERCLGIAAQLGYTKYVRGCSGFCGFPEKSFDADRLVELSDSFSQMLHDRWSDWGSEQFMSNLILSNLPETVVLPYDLYSVPARFSERSVFVHFIGYQRYQNTLYSKLTKRIIANINS
ncbi:hypothetical protein ACLG6S_04025 [Thermodesulfobacteriota bacterium B35]